MDHEGTQWCIDRQESCEQQSSFASKWENPCDDEGSFWSLVSYVTPAPVRVYIAPAPSSDAAPAPVVLYISPAPVGCATPAPVVDYIAPAPVVDAVPAPVVGYIMLVPVGYAGPAPVVDYVAPVPAVDAAPAPVAEFISPAPVGYAAPAPVAEQPHPPRQGDLTMEVRDDLMALLVAVGDEIYDRGEDPALGELVEQLMARTGWTTTRRRSPTMLVLRSLDSTTSGAAPLDASISRSTTATRMSATRTKASPHSPGALLVGSQWRPCAGPGLHRAVVVKERVADETERVLAVSESLCHPCGT